MASPGSDWWGALDKHYASIRAQVVRYLGEQDALHLDDAKLCKDHGEVSHILNRTWFVAPDDSTVYNDEGFRRLCDLMDGTIPE